MDQEDRALADLQQFISRSEGNSLWAALIKDAQRRVRQLGFSSGGVQRGSADPARVRKVLGFVLGASLASGSAGSGIAAASLWSESQRKADSLRSMERQNMQAEYDYLQGELASRNSSILTVAAIGLGVGATVSLLVAASTGSAPSASIAPPVVMPTETGAVLSWGATF